jgi:hypothetical protein
MRCRAGCPIIYPGCTRALSRHAPGPRAATLDARIRADPRLVDVSFSPPSPRRSFPTIPPKSHTSTSAPPPGPALSPTPRPAAARRSTDGIVPLGACLRLGPPIAPRAAPPGYLGFRVRRPPVVSNSRPGPTLRVSFIWYCACGL